RTIESRTYKIHSLRLMRAAEPRTSTGQHRRPCKHSTFGRVLHAEENPLASSLIPVHHRMALRRASPASRRQPAGLRPPCDTVWRLLSLPAIRPTQRSGMPMARLAFVVLGSLLMPTAASSAGVCVDMNTISFKTLTFPGSKINYYRPIQPGVPDT